MAASSKFRPRSANVLARLTGSKVRRIGYCSYRNLPLQQVRAAAADMQLNEYSSRIPHVPAPRVRIVVASFEVEPLRGENSTTT